MSTRREFLTKSILATAGASTTLHAFSNPDYLETGARKTQSPDKGVYTINIFSKSLHWLDYSGMASAAAELGFDGVDLTVRPEGHVIPERVSEDLPKAVEAVKKAGLNVFMITTAINNPDDQFTEPILKTASALGISYYRMGWITYDDKISIEDNLKRVKTRMSRLAELNKKYSIHGDYQNHAGANFGSAVWDLWMILKDLDSQWIGAQYDIRHAVVEGANSWPLGLKMLKSHIGTMDIKDFIWTKKETGWKAETVPLGEGMIDYKKYLNLIKQYNIKGPFSIHYEYPLGGAENGAKVITMKKEEALASMKRDIVSFKKLLTEAGLVN